VPERHQVVALEVTVVLLLLRESPLLMLAAAAVRLFLEQEDWAGLAAVVMVVLHLCQA
jgi:hypothetical protein